MKFRLSYGVPASDTTLGARWLRGQLDHKSAVTSHDILQDEFGEWPPEGLHYTETPRLQQRVIFKEFWQEWDWSKKPRTAKELVAFGQFLMGASWRFLTLNGCVLQEAGRGLYLNGLFSLHPRTLFHKHSPPEVAENVIGHEHLHVLQKDKGYDEPVTQIDLWHRPFYRAAFAHVSQLICQHALPRVGYVSPKLIYLAADAEQQARLHTVIANRYKVCKKLPKTREELWLQLTDAGLRPPQFVVERLSQTHQGQLTKIQRDPTPTTPAYKYKAAAELNQINEFGQKIGLDRYLWDCVFPYLYGHLLELYGDRGGRTKMGFPPDQLPEDAAKAHFEAHPLMPAAKLPIISVRRDI